MEGRVSNADQKTKKQTLFRGQKKLHQITWRERDSEKKNMANDTRKRQLGKLIFKKRKKMKVEKDYQDFQDRDPDIGEQQHGRGSQSLEWSWGESSLWPAHPSRNTWKTIPCHIWPTLPLAKVKFKHEIAPDQRPNSKHANSTLFFVLRFLLKFQIAPLLPKLLHEWWRIGCVSFDQIWVAFE